MSGNERRLLNSTRTPTAVPPASSEPDVPGRFTPAEEIGLPGERLMLIVCQGPLTIALNPQGRGDGGVPPTPGTSRRTRCFTLSTKTPRQKRNAHMSCAITFRRRGSSVNFPMGPCSPSKSKTHVLCRSGRTLDTIQILENRRPGWECRDLLPTRILRYGKQLHYHDSLGEANATQKPMELTPGPHSFQSGFRTSSLTPT